MSNLEFNKNKNLHNESANSIPITQEKPYNAIDMELVTKQTPKSLSIENSKDFVCIDIIENSIEHSTDDNEEVDTGILGNITNLKVHVINPAARRKPTILAFYESMVDFGKQQRLGRQIRRQNRSPKVQVTTHDDLIKSQDSLHVQGYPSGPGYLHTEEYPKGQGYPNGKNQVNNNIVRLRGGVTYEPGDRSKFVMLVLAITAKMLLVTDILVGTVLITPSLTKFFINHGLMLFYPATIALITVNCIFAYSDCARRLPGNFILLTITVVSMSVIASAASSAYETQIIFEAVLATTCVVIICTLLAFTNFDFTSYVVYIVIISLCFTMVCMIFFGIRITTGQKMKVVYLFLLLGCTLMQTLLLVAELQMILGGRSIELEEEDYALGAYYLYTSVINIFIKMVALIGTTNEEL